MSIPMQPSAPFTPVQQQTLSSGPIAYRQAGSGFPLLLVHGWGGSSRYWLDTLEAFADMRSVYALDLPGHGETPPLFDITSAERLAKLVIEFADALGLASFDLNGHSLGAAVAVYLAARWPTRVRNLVLTSLGTFRTQFERFLFGQAYIQMSLGLALWRPWLVLNRPWLALWQPWVDWMAHQPSVYRTLAGQFVHQLPADEMVVRQGVVEFLRTDRITALESAISVGDPGFAPALRQVHAPTLLVVADRDMIMPISGAQSMAELLPNCRLVQLDRCGHLPMIERPHEYHQLLREFFTANAA